MRKILVALLLLSILVASSSQVLMSKAQSGNLTGILATKSNNNGPGSDNGPLGKFQLNHVQWVISYDTIVNSTYVAAVHSQGLKLMVYVTALKEFSVAGGLFNGITTITPQESWAQVANDSAKTVMYPDPVAREYWFSPYGPYIDQVAIPRIQTNLAAGADGIFLDTLILYGDSSGRFADTSTYAYNYWQANYPTLSYQAFRYQSLHDAAKKIYNALKTANSNAVLFISDNNVCEQPNATAIQLRAEYASAIDLWGDSADGFVLESVGLIEAAYPPNPLLEAQVMVNNWRRETASPYNPTSVSALAYDVTKPIWLLGFTNETTVFNYLQSNSVTQGFGYWANEPYLATNTVVFQIPGGTSSAPALVSDGTEFYLVVRGTSNGIYYQKTTSGSWTGGTWTSLPGATSDVPAAAVVSGTLHLVVRGTDNGIYHNMMNLATGVWTGWEQLPGATSSSPALATSSGTLHLVVRGLDNGVYYNYWTTSSGWNGWYAFSGATNDVPSIAATGTTLNIVVRGTSNGIYYNSKSLSGGSWSGWTSLPGATSSSPTLLSSATNRLDLAVRGTNNGVYHIVWTSGSWGTWEALPGATNNKPALTVYDGTLYLAVTGTSTGIYYNTLALSSGSWTGWTNIPGATPSYPALAASNTYAYCNIVAQGTDNGIYWASVQ